MRVLLDRVNLLAAQAAMKPSAAFRQTASLSYAARMRQRYPYKPPSTSVDHIVVGGGVVGLSVAAGLVNTAGRDRTTFVVERNGQVSPC